MTFYYIALPLDDMFRPSLRVYPGGGNDYINAVIVVVNIRILVLTFFAN